MTDLDQSDRLDIIIDRVQDAVVSLPKPLPLLPGQLLHSGRARLRTKGFDLARHARCTSQGIGLRVFQ
jgi:hypothetical protein